MGEAKGVLARLLGGVASLAFATGAVAHAQVAPAATGPLSLSVFAGATGTFTGFMGGKNLSATVGVDLDLLPIWKFRPTLEGRATYPVHEGHLVGEANVLGGVRQPFNIPGFNRVHLQPYADVLFGEGRLMYPYGGRLNVSDKAAPADYDWFYTSSFTYAGGVGAKLRLNSHWALQGDIQLEHYSTPVTASGSIWSKPLTAAVVYRFDRFHDISPFRPVR